MRTVLMKLVYGLIYSAPVVLLTLAACGGGGGSSGGGQQEYSLGGSVSGLTGSGLILRNNVAAENISVPAGSTTFTFAHTLAVSAPYNVTVLTSPTSPRQNCDEISSASGVMPANNVTSVAVTCVNVYGLSVHVNRTNSGFTITNTYKPSAGAAVSSVPWTILPLGVAVITPGDHNFEFSTLFQAGGTYDLIVNATSGVAETCTFVNSVSSVSAIEVSGVIPTSDVLFDIVCI
jgi:hypothetical protein